MKKGSICLSFRKIFYAVWFTVFFFTTPGLTGEIRHRFDVRIPMRDGVELSADMWMPAKPGKYPVILIRTPYLKTMKEIDPTGRGEFFTQADYIFMVQDVRGRGDSDGIFNFFFQEGKDGYDTIEWIAKQPWCNGKVGMMGVSYLATVQWLAARERPPHLCCIVPTAPGGKIWDEIGYIGGAFAGGHAILWLNDTSGKISQGLNARKVDWMTLLLQHRPLKTMDEALGRPMRLYQEFLQHSTLDDYWKRLVFTVEDFRQLDLPALTITGLFDVDQIGSLYYWSGMRQFSPARDKQYLLIGPWNHQQTFMGGQEKLGEMEFTKESIVDFNALHRAFFDCYLKGEAANFDFPRARVYVSGSNTWREFKEYPPAQAVKKKLYFHGKGKANSLKGDGKLSWQAPRQEKPDQYIFDPKKPVAFDFKNLNACNRIEIEKRQDVLVYTSGVLKKPLEVIGSVHVVLYASSDAPDTDFAASIVDVFPDGRAVSIGPWSSGIKRARFRNGYEKEELLTPGKTEKYKINLWDICHTFLPGHRIRIEIHHSLFPFVTTNQNTGNPIATDTEWKIAHQTVYHDKKRPSHVVLPIMPAQNN